MITPRRKKSTPRPLGCCRALALSLALLASAVLNAQAPAQQLPGGNAPGAAPRAPQAPAGRNPNAPAQRPPQDYRVRFGGQNAPLPQMPRGHSPGTAPQQRGDDGSVANALKNWFKEPQNANGGAGSTPVNNDVANEPGLDGSGVPGAVPPGASGFPGGEPPASEGENKQDLFKKFVSLFQSEEEDDGSREEDESFRKIKDLERVADRNFRRARLTEAKKNLNDLVTLKPYDPDYHFALGLVFREEQRYEDAMKKYQDVLDLGGPSPLVYLLMAEAVAQEGDTDKTFEHLRQAAVGGRNIIQDIQSLTLLTDYKSDTEFIKLALSLEKYVLLSKKGQDPMTQAFERTGGGGRGDRILDPDPITKPDTSLTPEEQQKVLNDARKAYDRVIWFIKLEDEDKAMENYQQLRSYIAKKEYLTIPKIANDFRLLIGRMPALEAQIENIRLKFYYNQALAQLQKMKDAFQEGEFNRVKGIFEEVKKLAKEMENTNPRFLPVAEKVLASGKVWIRRTAIREEFASNKPTIQGIVISPVDKKAIINNRIYRQGEEFRDFLVQKVENNRVTFRYKGEEIPLIFRRY